MKPVRVLRVALTEAERRYLALHGPTLLAAQHAAAQTHPEYEQSRDGPLLYREHIHVGRLAWRATVERLMLGGLREERMPDGGARLVREPGASPLLRLADALIDAALDAGWGGAEG